MTCLQILIALVGVACTAEALGKITGGNRAGKDEYPHQVLLFYEGQGDNGFFCGGSILNENYVLSAAHCFYGYPDLSKYWLAAGKYRVNNDVGSEQYRNITELHFHPDYKNETFENDIIVVKVDRPFVWTKEVQPTELATQDFEPKTNCWLSGRGWVNEHKEIYAKVNQEYQVTIVRQGKCRRLAAKYDRGDAITETVFCTKDIRKGACNSDSGGPVTCFNSTTGGFTQIGIQSWTVASKKCGSGLNVDVRVNQYLDFIRDVTGIQYPINFTFDRRRLGRGHQNQRPK